MDNHKQQRDQLISYMKTILLGLSQEHGGMTMNEIFEKYPLHKRIYAYIKLIEAQDKHEIERPKDEKPNWYTPGGGSVGPNCEPTINDLCKEGFHKLQYFIASDYSFTGKAKCFLCDEIFDVKEVQAGSMCIFEEEPTDVEELMEEITNIEIDNENQLINDTAMEIVTDVEENLYGDTPDSDTKEAE